MISPFPFEKIHSCGNDFILLDFQPDAPLTAALCDRHHGIGADGIMFRLPNSHCGWELGHFDPDGSRSLCLNGLRAALACLHLKGVAPRSGSLLYEGKNIHFDMDEREVRILFTAEFKSHLLIWNGPPRICGYKIDIGNPHFVIDDSIDDLTFAQVAPRIRADLNCNVHRIQPHDLGWSIRSFERGVEDFTLACASGMAAAGLVVHLHHGCSSFTFFPDGKGQVRFAFEDDKIAIGGAVSWVASGVWRC